MPSHFPYIYAKRFAVDIKALPPETIYDINIDFCIKTTELVGWKMDLVKRGLKILVVQLTGDLAKNVNDLLVQGSIDGQEAFDKIKESGLLKQEENYRIFSMPLNHRVAVTQDPKEFVIPFVTSIDSTRGSFQAPAGSSYLTYVFIPYSLNGETDDVLKPKSVGDVTIEKVISNGSFVELASRFFIEEGAPWDGPVTRTSNGTWKTAVEPPEVGLPLQVKSVPNSTISNAVILNQLKNIDYDFSYDTTSNNAYFSEIFLSRDPASDCRFSFSVDFGKMVEHASKLPWIFKNPSTATRITNASKIESLKILRRRTSTRFATNKLFTPVISKSLTNKEELIVISADSGPKTFRPNSNIIQNTDNTVYEVGNIREIKLVSDTPRIRTFTGADTSSSEIADGIYQYGIEVIVKDPVPQFLKSKKDLLQNEIAYLEDYHIESLKNYNNISRRFKKELVGKVSSSKIMKSLENYADILQIITNNQGINFNTLPMQLYKLICPMNGLPENILKILGLMTDLSRTIESLLGQGHKSKTTKSNRGFEAPSVFKTATQGISKVYEKWSDNLYNSNLPKNTGYYFINPTSATTNGHAIISWNDYDSVISNQTIKLFPEPGPFNLPGVAAPVELSSTKHKFLTPIKVGLGGSELFDFSSNNESEFYNLDKYNSILNEILRFNYNMAIVGDESLYTTSENFTKFGQKLRNGLVDFFAEQGCTVDNMVSFSSQQITTAPEQTSTVDQDTSSVDALPPGVEASQSHQISYEDDVVNPNNILARLSEDFIAYDLSLIHI